MGYSKKESKREKQGGNSQYRISKFHSCYNKCMDMYDSKLTKAQIMTMLLKWAEQGEKEGVDVVCSRFRLKTYASA